ncbi:unnamed protein product [Closterium sp. Naga37s-1]|nr:unnamed protein product [Closterium sp. Naga37s-1]
MSLRTDPRVTAYLCPRWYPVLLSVSIPVTRHVPIRVLPTISFLHPCAPIPVGPSSVRPSPVRPSSVRPSPVRPSPCAHPPCMRVTFRRQAKEVLVYLLSSDVFLQQVATQPGVPAGITGTEFTGELFTPVPWSPTTRFGMPQELEKYNEDKENYIIINVPPNFMFKAQIFKPSRLCAIFKVLRDQ